MSRPYARPHALRAALVLPAVVLLGTALVGCGGDDSEGMGSDPPTTAGSTGAGLEVSDGISPDDLLGCLADAGLPAELTDTTPLGVEVATEGIEVQPLDGWDGDQGVDLWVFADPAAAAANRAAITLSDEDTPTSRIAGNVVVRYFAVPEPHDQQLADLDACLPS